jgi:hypothetical protein
VSTGKRKTSKKSVDYICKSHEKLMLAFIARFQLAHPKHPVIVVYQSYLSPINLSNSLK